MTSHFSLKIITPHLWDDQSLVWCNIYNHDRWRMIKYVRKCCPSSTKTESPNTSPTKTAAPTVRSRSTHHNSETLFISERDSILQTTVILFPHLQRTDPQLYQSNRAFLEQQYVISSSSNWNCYRQSGCLYGQIPSDLSRWCVSLEAVLFAALSFDGCEGSAVIRAEFYDCNWVQIFRFVEAADGDADSNGLNLRKFCIS